MNCQEIFLSFYRKSNVFFVKCYLEKRETIIGNAEIPMHISFSLCIFLGTKDKIMCVPFGAGLDS